MAQQWFKFYGAEYLSDPKIDRLTPVERCCWITLLCLASQSSDGIVKYLTVETLLSRSGVKFDPYDTSEWDNGLSVLITLENLEMISVLENGDIQLINWEKRQEHNLTEAERKAKYRAKKAEEVDNVPKGDGTMSQQNRIEENRIDKNREGKEVAIATTPSDIFKSFIENPNDVISFLQGKGFSQEMVKQEVKKFISYWTEPNKSGKKQRWELEKTFEVKRRLANWFNNVQKFNKDYKPNDTTAVLPKKWSPEMQTQ